MPELDAHEISRALDRWRAGEPDAVDQLFPLVYEELRSRARRQIGRERGGHTLQPTALVHEAFLRLAKAESLPAENRVHFYAIASRVMRQVLVDHARGFRAEKRGGAAQRLSVTDADLAPERSAADILDLNEALERLFALDERKARVVDMRYFGGMTEAEIAIVLGVTEKTVRRDWQFAKVWLYRELSME